MRCFFGGGGWIAGGGLLNRLNREATGDGRVRGLYRGQGFRRYIVEPVNTAVVEIGQR